MLASSFGDPVIGLDIHYELVPTPAPTPTPIPNPFTGVIFDPIGLAIGLVVTSAINFVTGAPPAGPVVYWGTFPATNTGTEAKHVPGHILIPPGTAWAPFPKTPKPVIHPGETPKPPNPVKPEDDAICVFGSKTVTVMGSNAVRLGDILLSCSEPIRLPSSVVMAVPKGAPILIGGPPSLDLMAAAFASLRTRFVSDSLHAALSRMKPSRFRNMLHRGVCFFTGHPVDVAMGRVMTSSVDIEITGPLPLRIERSYSSAFASRQGPVGYGWSLSLDQAVWEERGKVVFLAEDGRELEFDTFNYSDHRMRPGDELWHPIHRLTLRRKANSRWEIESHDGVVREFEPVSGRSDGRAMIQRVRSRCRFQQIAFSYDQRGRLEWVRDSAGRLINLEHDDQDRVIALRLPLPHGPGMYVHRHYEYDADGDLVRVTDSRGADWNFEYVSHLLTRESDRTGLSFYFAYDGLGEDAWCIRTWGDGGIYDHIIAYDKQNRATYVTDSRGSTRQYHMNLAGLVVKIVDPLGGTASLDYDPQTLQLTSTVDALGRETRCNYDARGNLIARSQPDGSSITVEYDARNLPTRATDAVGNRWSCKYDQHGLLTEMTGPTGLRTVLSWMEGMVIAVWHPDGTRVSLEYGPDKTILSHVEDGLVNIRYAYDRLGRLTASEVGGKVLTQVRRDLEGNVVEIVGPEGQTQSAAFDEEACLLEYRDAVDTVRYRYGHMHRLELVEQGDTTLRYLYDTEDNLVSVVNEAGDTQRFEHDDAGRIIADTAFDGRRRRFNRDAAGRVVEVVEPSGRSLKLYYDAVDRMVKLEPSDGAPTEFEYRPDGELVGARNGEVDVRFELDAVGRVRLEEVGGERVESAYGPGGSRTVVRSSLGARLAIERDQDDAVAALVFGALPRETARLVVDRDALGWERRYTFAGSLDVQWELDSAGRPMIRRTQRRQDGSWHEMDARQYEWRGLDRIVSIVGLPRGTGAMEHDARGYAVREQNPAGAVERGVDRVGNIYASRDLSDRRYGPAGQLVWEDGADLVYDADGYLTERREPSGHSWRYRWRGGMLREVERWDGLVARFEYDPFARRTRKLVVWRGANGEERLEDDVRFVWDGHHLLHERSSKRGLTTWYWQPETFRPVVRERDGRRWNCVTDHVGVVTEMYDEEARLTWQGSLNLHGRATVHVGAPEDCPWRWPGGYEDPEVELVYLRHRYLTRSGVFISPDPLGVLGGLRAYGYVADPLVEIDPLGLHTIYPKLNGRPVRNPALGNKPLWPNIHGSGANPEASNGLGRLGDSENLLLSHLEGEHNAGRINLDNGFLEMESVRRGAQGALPPCDMCGAGLQRFANDHGIMIVYRETTGRGGLRRVLREWVFRPHTPVQMTENPGCG